ncbi:hypothetical protein [Caudoviricetes sp.]|nr:hypothetical protein [Caudoviricetes sp.]
MTSRAFPAWGGVFFYARDAPTADEYRSILLGGILPSFSCTRQSVLTSLTHSSTIDRGGTK